MHIPLTLKETIFIVFFMQAFFFYGKGQSITRISLKNAIEIAKKNSLDYKMAVYMARSSFWDFNAYKASLVPRLSLSGTLPNYYRTINLITLPNGENNFVSQNIANSSLSLNLSQNISATGGNIALSSSLRRIDNLGNSSNTAYTSVPFALSYFQNNLFYNPFKWRKKIEPLKLLESQKEYIEKLEDISYRTVDKYFDLLLANIQFELDQQNLKNIDTLLKITQSRFEIGTVNLNDILQTKVSLLNAKKSLTNSRLALQNTTQAFVRYLNLNGNDSINLSIPDSLFFFDITSGDALMQAKNNRKYATAFKRRLLQAEETVSRTRSETGASLNLMANFGLTQTGSTLSNSYADLIRNQSLIVGFFIPLVDWNVNKSNRKRAQAILDLEKTNIAQEELTIEQEVYTNVMKWEFQKEQMDISKETSKLAKQRYEIARQKYSVGSITYTDFNNAQLDKDKAITDLINNLRAYWVSYYMLRKITLYDYEKKEKIGLLDIILD